MQPQSPVQSKSHRSAAVSEVPAGCLKDACCVNRCKAFCPATHNELQSCIKPAMQFNKPYDVCTVNKKWTECWNISWKDY